CPRPRRKQRGIARAQADDEQPARRAGLAGDGRLSVPSSWFAHVPSAGAPPRLLAASGARRATAMVARALLRLVARSGPPFAANSAAASHTDGVPTCRRTAAEGCGT